MTLTDKEKIEEVLRIVKLNLEIGKVRGKRPDKKTTIVWLQDGMRNIKNILEKKTLTDYEKLVVDMRNEITYLYDNEKPTKANYEMTIQRIKKRIKYPNLPRGIGGMESLEKSIRRRIVLQEERTKSTKKDYENTIQQIKELLESTDFS